MTDDPSKKTRQLPAAESNDATGTRQVEAFLETLEHPFKAEIENLRALILQSREGISERIKWNAPSFCVGGDDRITMNLQGKGFFRLIFHCGAKVRKPAPIAPIVDDPAGLLEWASNDRAILKVTGSADLEAKQASIADLVRRWIEETAPHAD
ncbi:DUF1801 domain-containing protein [Cohnella sp. REN36]|uniref:DUF1801 domain-containing protein n=1 Tax=Cohnella sp. REN36 TaxID=2887347 RepID=UPI001D150AF9|nr:DUF1801 domain-containing protein [Cohnella sp. REN36]MCC3371555.1 DUF1801 domain-containing protein [Cohnella sp. REN36]